MFDQVYGREHHQCDNPYENAPIWAVELGALLIIILSNQEKIMADLNSLAAAVAAEDTTIDSAVVLLQGIPALIAAAGTDQVALQKLQDDITAKTATLAAAVVTGTPTPTNAPPVTPAAATASANAAVAGS